MFSLHTTHTHDAPRTRTPQPEPQLRIYVRCSYIGLTPVRFVSIHVRSFQSWFNSGDRPVYLPLDFWILPPHSHTPHGVYSFTAFAFSFYARFIKKYPAPFTFSLRLVRARALEQPK